ncbi:unnamed protein product, partial [Discosporangium mesarthrocarpum]
NNPIVWLQATNGKEAGVAMESYRRNPATPQRDGLDDHIKRSLRDIHKYPPPTSSLEVGQAFRKGDGFAPVQLVAINKEMDVAILCEENTLRTMNLMDDEPMQEVRFSATRQTGVPEESDAELSIKIPEKEKITGIEFSPEGEYLLIWGKHYIGVAYLPSFPGSRRSHRSCSGSRGDGTGSTRHRMGKEGFLWDMSAYACDQGNGRVVQVSWNPLSDKCLTIIAVADKDRKTKACLMLHVIGQRVPSKVLRLPRSTDADGRGCWPVAFAHGEGWGWQRFVLWILWQDGAIGALSPVIPPKSSIFKREL